jgi:phenylalanyl-tRNA synthetase alpha chain
MNLNDIKALKERLQTEISKIENSCDLEKFRLKYLVRKGEINDLLEEMKSMPVEEKRVFGPTLNDFKKNITESYEQKKKKLAGQSQECFFDYTVPGKKPEIGSIHPITLITRKIVDVFVSFGFDVFETNEIESEYYNFDSLNIEKSHPARDM